jgi:IS30 family transposase
MARAAFTQITRSEREVIRRLISLGRSAEGIAKILGKHRSSIFRELRRNKNAGDQYYELHAQALLKRRRLHAKAARRRIENDLQFEAYIEKLPRFGLSPDSDCDHQNQAGRNQAPRPQQIEINPAPPQEREPEPLVHDH